QLVTLGPPFRLSGNVTDAASGQLVDGFVVSARFAQTSSLNADTSTNFGAWESRKQFSGGKFNLYYEYPLLTGSQKMHDWQFRLGADGYEPAVPRLVRDDERGSRLNFQLPRRPLPEIALAAPTAHRRVTAAAAVQPRTVRAGE